MYFIMRIISHSVQRVAGHSLLRWRFFSYLGSPISIKSLSFARYQKRQSRKLRREFKSQNHRIMTDKLSPVQILRMPPCSAVYGASLGKMIIFSYPVCQYGLTGGNYRNYVVRIPLKLFQNKKILLFIVRILYDFLGARIRDRFFWGK